MSTDIALGAVGCVLLCIGAVVVGVVCLVIFSGVCNKQWNRLLDKILPHRNYPEQLDPVNQKEET